MLLLNFEKSLSQRGAGAHQAQVEDGDSHSLTPNCFSHHPYPLLVQGVAKVLNHHVYLAQPQKETSTIMIPSTQYLIILIFATQHKDECGVINVWDSKYQNRKKHIIFLASDYSCPSSTSSLEFLEIS